MHAGLPHCHMLFWYAPGCEPRTAEDVDSIISAELPDPENEKELFDLIVGSHIHGPCGAENPEAKCCQKENFKGRCKDQYPRPYSENTVLSDEGYPNYRRRKNGVKVKILATLANGTRKVIEIDNRHVFPYNKALTLKYRAHINVELCSGIRMIKYLHK